MKKSDHKLWELLGERLENFLHWSHGIRSSIEGIGAWLSAWLESLVESARVFKAIPTRARSLVQSVCDNLENWGEDAVEKAATVPASLEMKRRVFSWSGLPFWARGMIVAILGMPLFGGLLVWQGVPAWMEWRNDRLLAQAVSFFDAGDTRGAVLTARQLLDRAPNHIEANRLMAEIGESAWLDDTLRYRANVARLEPESASNYVDWARSAMHLNQPRELGRILFEMPAEMDGTAARLTVAHEYYFVQRNYASAEKKLRALLELEPDHHIAQLHLAGLHLAIGTPLERRKALDTLARFVSARDVQWEQALRQLLSFHLGRGDWLEALPLVADLPSVGALQPSTQILVLQTYQTAGQSPKRREVLLDIKLAAEKAGPGAAMMLVEYLTWNGENHVILNWWKQSPEFWESQPRLLVRLAGTLFENGDWETLDRLLNRSRLWGGQEHARLAYLALSFQRANQEETARSTWQLALQQASGRPEHLRDLLSLAGWHNWDGKRNDVLATASARYPHEVWSSAVASERG